MPNISDLAPEPTDCGTVIIRGPKGDPGEAGPPGETELLVTDPITADGTGTEGDPYVIGLGLSTDSGNNLKIGADGGLYSPAPDGSETSVAAGTGTSVTGSGTAPDPYVIASTVTASSLGAITSVTGTDGITTTTSGTDVTVSADISTTDGNQLTVDADGLYVAAQTAVGDNTYVIGDGLVQSGTGTAEDPYVLSVDVSADTGNALTLGTDGGLYVPDVPAGVSSVSAANDTVTVTPTSGDVTVAANLSADTGNALVAGSDGGLYVPEPAAPAYAAIGLAEATVTSASWAAMPLVLLEGSGVTVDGSVVTVTEPGVWLYTLHVAAGGTSSSTDASLYVRVTPGSIYGSVTFANKPQSQTIIGTSGYVSFDSGTLNLTADVQASALGTITVRALQFNLWRVAPTPTVAGGMR